MTLMDELARAGHGALHEAGRRIPPPMDDHAKAAWVIAVRAILTRLREPTPEMVEAGRMLTGSRPLAKAAFTRMIDAMLEEG